MAMGLHVLEGDLVDTVLRGGKVCQAVYDAYHEVDRDAESFDAMMHAPLLLSSEQDMLLEGLRKVSL